MGKKHHSSAVLRHTKGFTLLELLIALSLSAILMTVLVTGLSQISSDWEKQGEKLEQKIDESLLLLQLEKAILGTFPYRFREHSLAQETLFFEGGKSKLSWVSTASPDHNNSLTLWHLEADQDNGFRLTVLPAYPGNLHKQLETAQTEQKHPMIFFKDYKVSMHYLVVTTNQKKNWQTSFSGTDKNEFPLAVRIQFEQKENVSQQDMDFSVFSFIRSNANGR